MTKAKARSLVTQAVEKGILVRPKVCSLCQTETDIQAHHRDYNKPLEVEWLCRMCHSGQHKPIRKTHCKRGHEYTEENTRLEFTKANSGSTYMTKHCRECGRASQRKYWKTKQIKLLTKV